MAQPNSTVNVNAALGRKLLEFRDSVLAGQAARAEQYAKLNAPWTNRTGDARRLLKGIVLANNEVTLDMYKQEEGKAVKAGTATIDGKGCMGVALAYRVEYGKRLEKVSNGRYAILKPTIESIRSEVLAAWHEFFGGR